MTLAYMYMHCQEGGFVSPAIYFCIMLFGLPDISVTCPVGSPSQLAACAVTSMY